jgi:uncharacterized membrane protein
MKIRIRHLWEIATSGYWFVPSLMTGAAAVSAFVLLYVDRTWLGPGVSIGWLYSGGSEGAKTLLSTVAGSTITVAGVVFSITIAALTQASSQFGPRLLRNFMRDTSNQVVLGTFVATFLYCLLILRTIHGKLEDGSAFVPQASVTGAVLMAVASIAVLIYFIHHISTLLQAPNVVAAVLADFGREMDDVVNRNQHECPPADPAAESEPLPPQFENESRAVKSTSDGYIQAVDYADLIDLAREANLLLHLIVRSGDYAIEGNTLLRAWPGDKCTDEMQNRLQNAFLRGTHRTSEQDIEYAIRQMAEIAVRALSPGINDPFTAINCIDSLGSAICRVARSGLPGARRYDSAGSLRVILSASTFDGIVEMAFNQIRQYGRDSVAVTVRLLEVLKACGAQCSSPDQRAALLRQAEMVYRQSQNPEAIPEKRDREDVQARWDGIVHALAPTEE